MNIESINQKHFKATIKIIAPVLLITFLGLAYFTYLFSRDDISNRQTNLRQSIHSYQSNISEKISILASSNTFIDFIRSGEQSRTEQLLDLKILFSNLKDDTVSGITLINEEESEIFSQGSSSPHFVDLKICYLNDFLNPKMGSCRLLLRVHLDPNNIARQLLKVNPDIELCSECIQTPFILKGEFGSFQIASSADLRLPIKIKKSDNLKALIVFEILLMFLTMVLFFIIHREFATVSRDYLYAPVKDLVRALGSKNRLDSSNFEIYEFKLLAESINTFIESAENQEALRRRAELGEMATQVAHDLRSPLGILKSIEKDLLNLPSSTLRVFELGMNRLEEITDHLLNNHKRSDKVLLEETNEIINLSDLIQSVVEEKKLEFSNNPVEFDLNVAKNADSYSIVDPVSLKNIVSNMINNGVDSVKTKQAKISIRISSDDSFNCISVEDNGSGISNTVLKNLFQKGFSTKLNGNGLGLYNAYKQIKMHSGDIKVKSVFDEGTTFQIFLPKSVSNLKNESEPVIILIDDDKFIRLNWSLYFNKNSKKVHTFNSVESFLIESPNIHSSSIIFVDSDLGTGVRGEIESEEIYRKGFKNIYLSTGYAKSSIPETYWIKEICSKNPAEALELIENNNCTVKLVASSEFSQNSLVIGPSISNAESLLLPDDTKPEVSGSV